MFGQAMQAVGALRAAVGELDPACLRGADAARLVEVFAEGERVCAAGRALAARRVAESGQWRQHGHRSAANYLAAATGTSVGQAVACLKTARALEDLPATEQAFRDGRLSEDQAREITAAAEASPESEEGLVEAARTYTVAELRRRCRVVKAAASKAETENYERIRAGRYLRHWSDHDGAVRLDARLTPDDGARLLAAVEARKDVIFAEARRAGRRERPEAYAADALVDLACASEAGSGGPQAVVHVRVDHDAWVRGHTEAGEVCEIDGIGPIPVAVARRLGDDATLKVVLTDGVDVTGVCTWGGPCPPACARPWRPEIPPAWCPAVTSGGASRSTTASPGPTEAPPPSTTWPACAAGTTT